MCETAERLTFGALTVEEREEIVDKEEATRSDIETGLKSLIKRHGLKKIMDTVVRVSEE